jgi:hypothetical protein
MTQLRGSPMREPTDSRACCVWHSVCSPHNSSRIQEVSGDALGSVGGEAVISTTLEKNDNPPDWSVDVLAKSGGESEAKVDTCNGSIIAVTIGG